jgi:hypothetical protein
MDDIVFPPVCRAAAALRSHLIRRIPWVQTDMRQGRKVFFSEEKKQKTFMSLSRIYPAAHATRAKVFWFFFPKKNCFLAVFYR